MRFIFAIISFVLAFVLIGYGIAQRTFLAAPDNVTASLTLSSDAPVTVIDSKTLRSRDGHQSIQVSGLGKVFAAYGRTADVHAWVGDASYNKIGVNAEKTALTNKVIAGKAETVPDPRGSDLWLDEYSSPASLDFTVNVPSGISVIVASDGKHAAPQDIAIRWPLDNRTPWAIPLIIAGVAMLLVGLGMYLWALSHLRRARGPRRKSPKMPKVPRQRGYQRPKSKVVQVRSGRRSATRRMTAIVPVILVGAVVLSGCTSDQWSQVIGGGGSTPTPTATVSPDAATQFKPPVVTVPQLRTIVSKISEVSAKADETGNATLLATRFEGAPLQLRSANYAIHKVDATFAALPPIPDHVRVTLPQQQDKWPRTVFAVVDNVKDKTIAPMALMLVQETARDNFKVNYAMPLEAKIELPHVAPASLGAPRLLPDFKFLVLPPSKLAVGYGDLLLNGETSEYNKYFDTASDKLLAAITASKAKQKADLPATAKITFTSAAGPTDPIVFGTNDSGAIVAVYVSQVESVVPSEAGASVNPEASVKSLSGVTSTTKGVTATYGDQLLFYVPKLGSKEKILLLGYADGLISAKENP